MTDLVKWEKVSTPELRQELARGLTLTAEHLTKLGVIWAELERRGEDLSELRHGLARTLPLIAAGRLAAEAVVAFAGRPAILRAIDGVPLDRQRAYAAGEEVDVINPTDPSTVHRVSLESLPAAAIRLVFAHGEVRSPQAQRLALSPRRREKPKAERSFRPAYDPESGIITVGNMRVKLQDMLSAFAAASGPDKPFAVDLPEEYITVRGRLAKDEHQRFLAQVKRTGLPDWELIRKAMRAFGLI